MLYFSKKNGAELTLEFRINSETEYHKYALQIFLPNCTKSGCSV